MKPTTADPEQLLARRLSAGPRLRPVTAGYFYLWIPGVVLAGTVLVLSVPYLAVIAVLGVLVAAFAGIVALAGALAAAVCSLGRRAAPVRRGWR